MPGLRSAHRPGEGAAGGCGIVSILRVCCPETYLGLNSAVDASRDCFPQEEQLDLVSFGSSVEAEESPLVFLEKVHLFRERVEQFTACPLPLLVSLSPTPQAADFLQQHWASISIGNLEEAPVPKVCCCARCGSVGAAAETETGVVETDSQDQQSMLGTVHLVGVLGLLLVVLLGLLLADPVERFSLDLSPFGQLVHSLSSRTMSWFCDVAQYSNAAIEAGVGICGSYLSAMSQKGFQHLTVLVNALRS